MQPKIILTRKSRQIENLVLLLTDDEHFPAGLFTKAEKSYIRVQKDKHKKEFISFNRLEFRIYIYFIKKELDAHKLMEECRRMGDKVGSCLNDHKVKNAVIYDPGSKGKEALAFAEGMALGSYQFLKYKNEEKTGNSLQEIQICSGSVEESDIKQLNIIVDAVYRCRTLINEPNSYLTASVFGSEVEKLAKDCGARAEVMNKKKLEALKMGGILAVNKGSDEPPTFTVMEWNPSSARNTKPFVFIGKGVVFDSGGMNLKPGNSMLDMKDDMSGAASVATVIYAIAKAKLPVHIIGLMPATDNRPGAQAIVPGDVIRMHSGMNVEVIDTDAEGRMILADALSYAKKYNPGLVIDLATLTGSAVRAVGKAAAVVMQNKAEKEVITLKNSGLEVHERLVEFPMWEDYADFLKSEVADIKNLGPPEAGAITAAKFLEKFTGYPYIHIDIAGPAFLDKRDSYRGQGGTGFGVRLLFNFINKIVIDH